MASIDFSKFNQKPSAITGSAGKTAKALLVGNLKKYLVNNVPDASKAIVEEKLKPISIAIDDVKEKSLKLLIDEVLMGSFSNDNEMKGILTALSEKLKDNTRNVGNIVGFDLPLKDNPGLKKEYHKAKTKAYAEIIHLPAVVIDKLTESDGDIDDLGGTAIKKLTDEHTITAAQAKALETIVNLGRLSDGNQPLMKELYNSDITIEHFIDYDAADWKAVITAKNIPILEGESSIDSYAKKLTQMMELSFPNAFFLNRLNKKDFTNELRTFYAIEKISSLGGVTYKGSKIVLDNIEWTGVNEEEKVQLQKDKEALQAFVYTYKYFDITDTLAKTDIDISAKKQAVQKKLDQLNTFYKKNEQLDLLQVDFFNPAITLDYTGVEESNRPLVRKQAMAFQRMQKIGSTAKTRQQLMSKGFSSAWDIIEAGEREFVSSAGLPLNEAKDVYTTALNIVTATSHFAQAIRDTQRGGFTALAVNNMRQMVNDLRQIDGYSELFGNQDYCECEHCKSIFSPAAYFTNLMLFIDKHVTQRYFGGHEDSDLKLGNRRPDLWKLALSCKNTSTEIPYLDVVNDVLEQYIQLALNLDTIDQVYEQLYNWELSSGLPFNLPLEELRTYLRHFEISLGDVYKLLNEEDHKQQQERLLLSDNELSIIGTPKPAQAPTRFGNPPNLAQFPVSDFIRFAGISRTDLDEMVEVTSIAALGNMGIRVVESTEDIQQYKELLTAGSITAGNLDIVNRFVRLWKKTPWSIAEFDMILGALKNVGLFSPPPDHSLLEEKNETNHFKILVLADVISIQKALKLTVEELCAIIDVLPETSLNPNKKGLYERLFNLKEIFESDIDLTISNYGIDEKITPHLLAGLSVNEQELSVLFKLIGVNDIDEEVDLDNVVISRLYRQSRLAGGLKLSIEAFVAAVKVCIGNEEVRTMQQMIKLIDYKKWIDLTPFKPQQLDFILNGSESLGQTYNYNNEKVKAIVIEIKNTLPPGNPLTISLLYDKMQALFSISAEQLITYLSFIPAVDEAIITAALNSDIENPDNLYPVVELLQQLERKMLCFDKLKWNYDEVLFLKEHHAVFGVADLRSWSLDNIKAMVSYSKLFNSLPEETKADVRMVLQTSAQVNNFTETDIELFAASWSYPSALLHSIINIIPFTGILTTDTERLYQIAGICNTLGIQGDSFIKLKETTYEKLVEAKNVVYGAFASKYPDEKIRLDKLEAYHDKINTLKRDALCDYIISQRQLNFKDRSDLYYFFLLDMEMSGCFRTSRLLAAISSVQLYIHRCLMNLERSETSPSFGVDPDAIPAQQWNWMKNYRVWEANRKVFLYPENYIEPSLRDTKTPLFKELEDELLQQNITMDTAEAAYKKYLSEFLELAHLRYAGAYYNYVENNPITVGEHPSSTTARVIGDERFPDGDKTIYYLFARTHLQPYNYYYRVFNLYKNFWGHWQKIDLPIEAAEVSSIIQNGKLYVYWTEVQHKEVSKLSGGTPTPHGVIFKVYTKYSVLDANNSWSSPQRLFMGKVSTPDEDIFHRINVNNDINHGDENQDNKDSLIDKYKLEVFKKPYVIKTDRPGKLLIKHIYTKYLNIKEIEYRTKPFVGIVKYYDLLQYREQEFVVGPHTFTVTNNEFSRVLKQSFGNEDTLHGEIELISANTAIIRYGFKTSEITKDKTGVEMVTELPPQAIYKNNYTQHLYNQNDNPKSSFQGHELLSDDSMYKEMKLAFCNEPNVNSYYVEDGTADFTNGNMAIEQYNHGPAHINLDLINNDLIILNTILSNELNIIFFEKGLEDFLALETQNMPDSAGRHFDFSGPYGAYYWELFFHIPFLIANQLNGNQDFEGAKWWYERIFNPTSPEKPDTLKPGEHYWQFREFRNLDITRLRDILTDESAIAVYNEDPFDPHAIALLRLSAYQKAVVMKYIDNLLDWGDYLFTQDTQESIVEADMLYQLAQDILGKRPERTGKCKTEDDEKLTYEKIIAASDDGSEFLINLENVRSAVQSININDKAILERSKYLSKLLEELGDTDATPSKYKEWAALSNAVYQSDLANTSGTSTPVEVPLTTTAKSGILKYSDVTKIAYKPTTSQPKIQVDVNTPDIDLEYRFGTDRLPATDLVSASNLAFCIPVNENLLSYWDRVADRLFKIRNCMNISGIRRSLALYQPPIDPMLLVRAKAAGLSIEEIVAAGTGAAALPNYRFVYMLEKAKQFAQTVQGFGAALLSALEKKDGEELTLLRSVHERNILRLTKDIKSKQVQEAQKQYISLEESIANIENRIEYYNGLIEEGLSGWEIIEQASKKTALGIKSSEATLGFLASIFSHFPDVGSPFAMKYGGVALGSGAQRFADATGTLAAIADNIAILAAIEGSNQRREQEWNFQLLTANQEFKQATQQLLAANLRIKIAERDQEIHEKTIEQSTEVHEFFQGKFTNMGLYNFMATSLNRLYRMSYSMALEMAKQAEQCYKVETGNEPTSFIQSDNWQTQYAGLLAGEGLMLQLNQMEHSYMNQYKRCPEITQNFSLVIVDPGELLKLKQTGKCAIRIPEILFDILYPGQYRRLIRGLRISIPSIAGPYTNISANLRLTNSKVRVNETDENLIDNTPTEIPSITTSSAMNDSGTFEFSFRDERYLPFEYSGAISEWELSLPSKIRSFNYNSISDVILHLSYTAREGNREAGENRVIEAFEEYTAANGLFKVISLKNDFPDEFYKLLNNDPQLIEFDVTNDFFPYFLNDKTLSINGEVKVYLKPKRGKAVTVPDAGVLKINDSNVVRSIVNDIPANEAAPENDKIKGGTVELTGSPLKKWKIDAGSNGIDKDKTEDILILITYKIG